MVDPKILRARRLALAIRRIDDAKGTEAKDGGIGPIRLSGREWGELLSLANEITPPAFP